MAKKHKKAKFLIWGSIIGIIILVIFLRKCGVIGAEPLQEVVIEQPSQRLITELITANGKVQPEVEVKIAPEVSGEIVELAVKEGDWVKKGDLLIRIKADTYVSMKERAEASLLASKAQLSQAEAQLRQAKATFERQKTLVDQQAISQSDYETAVGQYESLVAQVAQAKANIEASKAQLKQSEEDLFKTTIYAPSDGTVSKLLVELGERVVGTATMAGTEMLRLADLSAMEVRAEVNENDIVRVEMGDSAKIEIDAYLGRKFDGVVTRIANSSISNTTTADQVTSYEVRIQIVPESYQDLVKEGIPSPFRPSMSSTVDIITNTKNCLAIPIQSVTTRVFGGAKKQVAFMFRADSSLVKQVDIATGIQDKEYIEVLSGLTKDDFVVSAPFVAISKVLKDGDKVTKSEKLGAKSVVNKKEEASMKDAHDEAQEKLEE